MNNNRARWPGLCFTSSSSILFFSFSRLLGTGCKRGCHPRELSSWTHGGDRKPRRVRPWDTDREKKVSFPLFSAPKKAFPSSSHLARPFGISRRGEALIRSRRYQEAEIIILRRNFFPSSSADLALLGQSVGVVGLFFSATPKNQSRTPKSWGGRCGCAPAARHE